jgi:hypothetical protein
MSFGKASQPRAVSTRICVDLSDFLLLLLDVVFIGVLIIGVVNNGMPETGIPLFGVLITGVPKPGVVVIGVPVTGGGISERSGLSSVFEGVSDASASCTGPPNLCKIDDIL